MSARRNAAGPSPRDPRRPRPRRHAVRCRAAAGLLLLAALAACTIVHETVGAAVPTDLSALRPGETTKAQALSLLGAPDSVLRQFDGELYTWLQSDNWSERLLLVPLLPLYSRTRGAARTDRLALLFDHRGVLAAVGVQREIPRE